MITFSPEHRYSAEECLQSKLFDKIRNREKENVTANVIYDCKNYFETEKEALLYLKE